MTTEDRRKNQKKIEKQKLKKAAMFLEELSWLLDGNLKRDISLREISNILTDKVDKQNDDLSLLEDQYVSPNPNIHYLIGVLPRLFQDRKLFRTNDEIGDFAYEVLNIDITRIEKRSKYELIGLIVCETNELNDNKLENLVESLRVISNNEEKLSQIAKERDTNNFSWNLAIRKLAN